MVKAFLSLCLMTALALITCSTIAMAQIEVPALEPCTTIWCDILGKFPELNAWLVVMFTAIGLSLRGISDFLGFAGEKLKKKSLSDWGKKLGEWATWAAQILGWFGGGTPRAVLMKHVEKELERTRPEIAVVAEPK